MTAPDPDRLNDLGKRLGELQTKQKAGAKHPAPSQSGIAGRIATELVAGLIVGGAIGWGIDHIFHTAPWGIMAFFILGAAAGLYGVIRTARQSNADAFAPKDVEEK